MLFSLEQERISNNPTIHIYFHQLCPCVFEPNVKIDSNRTSVRRRPLFDRTSTKQQKSEEKKAKLLTRTSFQKRNSRSKKEYLNIVKFIPSYLDWRMWRWKKQRKYILFRGEKSLLVRFDCLDIIVLFWQKSLFLPVPVTGCFQSQ